MDFLAKIWNSAINLIFPYKNTIPDTEQTVAPFNPHTLQFDITAKPLIKIIPAGQIDVNPPQDFQKIVNNLLNSFANGTDRLASPSAKFTGGMSGTITTFDIPEKDGHTLVKIVEDVTGRTVEVLHESETDIPEGVKEFAQDVTNIFTTTEAETFTKESSGGAPNFMNVYIIAALTLLIILAFSIGGIMWCKKNRVKTEKRNEYPVLAAANNGYMDPQALRSIEKMRSIP